MKKLVVRFLNDHGGGTAIRPHRGGISIAIIAVVNTIGTNLNTTFSEKETEEMALEPSKHVNGRMWPPGVSGNPNGRPVGSRTVFSQGFLKDLASVWAERGRAAMEKTAIDQPSRILCNVRQTDRPRGQADDRAELRWPDSG